MAASAKDLMAMGKQLMELGVSLCASAKGGYNEKESEVEGEGEGLLDSADSSDEESMEEESPEEESSEPEEAGAAPEDDKKKRMKLAMIRISKAK